MELMVAYKTGQSPRLADIVLHDDMHDIFFPELSFEAGV